jgi:nucleoside-diphosphate-sugar epimerase
MQRQLTWIDGDLTALDAPAVRLACAAFAPDTVIHTGWEGVAGSARNDHRQVHANVSAALDLVTLAGECGAAHFVGLGSQAEYGRCAGRIPEAHPLLPTTLYGAAKVAAAVVTRTHATLLGMRHTWLRVFSTYGAGSDASWVLPMAADAIARGVAPALTSCEQRWEFLHVRDAAGAIIAVAEGQATGTYNLGTGDARVLREVILGLRDRIDGSIAPMFGAVPYRPDQVMWLEADISRLQADTGWSPMVSLEAGLDEMAAEALAHRGEHAHA